MKTTISAGTPAAVSVRKTFPAATELPVAVEAWIRDWCAKNKRTRSFLYREAILEKVDREMRSAKSVR